MEFEIFIKDNAFIPDLVDIKTNTTVIFRNEDSIQHTIHCNGCTNFAPLSVKAGKLEKYVFGTRGKYLISDAGFGDMKCVVEATDMERENIPKRNYFLTSKEKKMLEEQEHMQKAPTPTPIATANEESPIFHSSSNLFATVGEDGVSARQLDEYRSNNNTRNGHTARRHRDKQEQQADSSSDSEDSEYSSISQQRTKFKQSTSKLSAAGNLNRSDNLRTGKTNVPVKPKVHQEDSGTVHAKRPASATPTLAIPASESVTAKPTVVNLPAKVVLIEDYAFQQDLVEVVVGQAVEFRLTQLVPAHAEHELCGTSTVMALNFASPLLQRDECSSFTLCPSVPGEINVACQVEKDMCCKIIVSVQSRCNNAAQRPCNEVSSPSAASIGVLSPPSPVASPTLKATPCASKSQDITSAPQSPELRGLAVATITATRSLSPSSPAMQDVRTALLQLESRDSRAELSESQSSFYDSDDIFSDFEAPANLQSTYNALTPNRKKNMEYGVPKREVSTVTERLRPAEMLTSPGRTVAHVVSLEEFTFRPNHLVIRCGDCVRFRRSSSQAAASLVCEGQFSDGAVSTPCALSTILAPGDPLAEEKYFCFDHVFLREGSFEVQNEIYSFSKCNVIVVPVTTPPEPSRANNPANNARKGPAPKLMGSFSAVSIAQPVFHKPIDVLAEATAGGGTRKDIPVPPTAGLAPPTTTTVNASTTTVSTTFSSSTSSTVPAALTTTVNRKSPELPQLSPRALPLFGSFQNLSHSRASPPSAAAAAAAAAATAGPVLPPLNELDDGAQSDSEGGEGGDEDAAAIRRKEKQREKQRRKRDKMKLKQKNKKQAAAQELLESELQPLLQADGGADEEDTEPKSPEAVINKYLSDSTKFRSYITAQADYGEEIEFADDSDHDAPLQKQDELISGKVIEVELPPSVAVIEQVSVDGFVGDTCTQSGADYEPLNGAKDHVESAECSASCEVLPPSLSTPAADPATKRKRNRSRTKSASKMDLSARFASVDDSPGQGNESAAPTTAPVTNVQGPLPVETTSALESAVQAEESPPSEPTEEATVQLESAATQSEFATPVKQRRRGSGTKPITAPLAFDAGDSFHTPPSRMPQTGNKAASTAARSANLLRAVLRISPLSSEKEMDTPNSNLFCTPEQYTPSVVRTASPVSQVASAEETRLSMLVAYEQQMEEFLLSRFEAIDAMIQRGIKDRLPSGKAVEVLYLRDTPEEHFDSVGARRCTPATGQPAAYLTAPPPAAPAAAVTSTGKAPAPAKATSGPANSGGGSASKKSATPKGKRKA